ncbi:hypothetical protein ACN47E_000884 [Coniothyrium glycines]
MADNVDDEVPTKRESHFNQQRSSHHSSLRSEASTGATTRIQVRGDQRRLEDFNLDPGNSPADYEPSETDSIPSLESAASPAPNVPYTRSPRGSEARKTRGSRGRSSLRSASGSKAGTERIPEESLVASESWRQLYDQNAHSPRVLLPLQRPRTREQRSRIDEEYTIGESLYDDAAQRPVHPLRRGTSGAESAPITALPAMNNAKSAHGVAHHFSSTHSPQSRQASRIATELYTISYLVFFAIWGALARIGLQALTFYPGAPVIFSELWANVAGTFIMGFLIEDQRLFAAEWGVDTALPLTPNTTSSEKARHGKVKKTIPLYIGLSTGFCGSFTSFSSFMRDIFLSLSNDLPSPINHPYPSNYPLPSPHSTAPRHNAYALAAVLATIFLTVSTCYSALHIGGHLASLLSPFLPTLPHRPTRRFVDPLFVALALGTWLAALVLAIFPPTGHTAWRGQALFAAVLAPPGCLLRYYASVLLNPILPCFPLGTFAANAFGTAVLGMAYNLQHVALSPAGVVGGSLAGCHVLQGVMDGFCGALTTVSTWIAELDSLTRTRRAAYAYALGSIGAGVGVLLVVMGSVRWSLGWSHAVCV